MFLSKLLELQQLNAPHVQAHAAVYWDIYWHA